MRDSKAVNADIVATIEIADRLEIEATEIVETHNGLQDDDPTDQPAQTPHPQS